ncbi:MAG: hypothetical protein R3B57_08810 [Phycisphaerales bacterium]
MTACRTRVSIAALALASGLPAAQAHVIHHDYFNQNNFFYQVLHVPDLDQVRAGLPNSGLYYCVPTSHMNFAAYIADHGYPLQQPGSHDWTTNAGKDAMTGHLATLGQFMSTNPTGGTSPEHALFGDLFWFLPYAVVTVFEMNDSYTPRLKSMAARAADGALITPRIGWYNEAAYPVISRNGGHCVSMTYARAFSSNEKYIGINDPGSDDGISSFQSPYTTEYYTVENRNVFPLPFLSQRTMSRIKGYGGNGYNGYIYGFYCITPAVTLVGADAHLVKAKFNFDDGQTHLFEIETENLATILGLAFAPDLFNTFYLTEANAQAAAALWQYDSVSDQSVQLAEVNDPIAVCTGRNFQVYVVDGRNLRCFTPEADVPSEVGAPIPVPVEQAVYDDLNDQVVCIAHGSRQFLRFNAGLGGDVGFEAWPSNLMLGDRYTATMDIPSGNIWFADTDNDKLFMVSRDMNGRLTAQSYGAPTLVGPRAIAINDAGEVIVACDGSVRVFRLGSPGQLVDITDGTSYQGMPTGNFLSVGCSRTNFDPSTYGGPDSVDILPTDFNGASKIPTRRFLPAFRP